MSEKWYLRSQNDGDAHHCDRVNDDGTVTARCGLTFLPERRLFGEGPAVVRPPVDPIQACPQCRAAGEKTEDPDGVAVRGLIEALSSPRSPRPLRKRFRLWTKKDGVTMSEESVRQPGQSEAIGASSQDGGHREHAELVNGLDGVLDVRGGLAAAIDGANHTVHGTEPCTDPHCTIQRPHGHSCPRCGPGTYDIIADLDG